MKDACPNCGGVLSTYKSKLVADGRLVRRYRKCKNKQCMYRERLLLRPEVIVQRRELG